jgi:hypothetical protein
LAGAAAAGFGTDVGAAAAGLAASDVRVSDAGLAVGAGPGLFVVPEVGADVAPPQATRMTVETAAIARKTRRLRGLVRIGAPPRDGLRHTGRTIEPASCDAASGRSVPTLFGG